MGKSLLPSLKEKKRYIKLSALEGRLNREEIDIVVKEYLGVLAYSKAGINFPKNNIIRCNSSSLTNVKAALCTSKQQIIINNVSGIISRVK